MPTLVAPQLGYVSVSRYDAETASWAVWEWGSDAPAAPEPSTSELVLRRSSDGGPLSRLVFQEWGSLAVLSGNLQLQRRIYETASEELAPKMAFDHFIELPERSECAVFGVGVPIYEGRTVRRSFLLQFEGDGYKATRLPFLRPVISQTVFAPSQEEAYVLAITYDTRWSARLEVTKLDSCDSSELWIDAPVDAVLDDATTRVDGIEFVPLVDASARWLVEPSRNGAKMINYDGTHLRVLEIDFSAKTVQSHRVVL